MAAHAPPAAFTKDDFDAYIDTNGKNSQIIDAEGTPWTIIARQWPAHRTGPAADSEEYTSGAWAQNLLASNLNFKRRRWNGPYLIADAGAPTTPSAGTRIPDACQGSPCYGYYDDYMADHSPFFYLVGETLGG
jgi:hypothetical protein